MRASSIRSLGRNDVGSGAVLSRKSRIVSKQQLEAAIYSFGEEVESNALEAHISRLRAKLGKGLIVTHRGLGYILAA